MGQNYNCLSRGEARDLEALEEIVAAGLAEFLRVGAALARIRSERLYRGAHPNFVTYLRVRWDMGKSHAYRLICAAEIDADLSHPQFGDARPRPQSESQIRSLADLDAAGRAEAWSRATALTGKPTAAAVEEAAQSVRLDRIAQRALANLPPAKQREVLAAGEKALDERRVKRVADETEAVENKQWARLLHHLHRSGKLATALSRRSLSVRVKKAKRVVKEVGKILAWLKLSEQDGSLLDASTG